MDSLSISEILFQNFISERQPSSPTASDHEEQNRRNDTVVNTTNGKITPCDEREVKSVFHYLDRNLTGREPDKAAPTAAGFAAAFLREVSLSPGYREAASEIKEKIKFLSFLMHLTERTGDFLKVFRYYRRVEAGEVPWGPGLDTYIITIIDRVLQEEAGIVGEEEEEEGVLKDPRNLVSVKYEVLEDGQTKHLKSNKNETYRDKEEYHPPKTEKFSKTVQTRGSGSVASTPYTCPVCEKGFKQRKRFQAHVESCQLKLEPDSSNIGIKNCDITNCDDEKGMEHCKFCKDCNTSVPKSSEHRCPKITAKKTIHACDACHRKFSSADRLAKHIFSHEQKRFKCDFCGHRTRYKSTLVRHLENMHEGETLVVECGVADCAEQVKINRLESHRFDAHGEGRECDLCRASSETYQEYEDHTDNHKVTCKRCYKRVTGLRGLHAHNSEVHGGGETVGKAEMATCQICGKILKAHSLNSHLTLTHGEASFCCTQCDYKTTRKDSLRIHIKARHSDVWEQCPVCGKKVKNKLKRHLKSCGKELEKIYPCPVCSKKFTNPERVRGHERTVHRGKNYVCDSCQYRTYSSFNLRLHQNKMHNAPSLEAECPVCNVKTNSIHWHIKTFHPVYFDTVKKTSSTLLSSSTGDSTMNCLPGGGSGELLDPDDASYMALSLPPGGQMEIVD